MHSQLRKSQLPNLQDKLRSKNEKEKELEEHNNFHKWLRELENACEYIGNCSPLQLRACHKVRHHLTLQNQDRTEKNFDNEHPMNNDSKNELQEEFCSFKLRRKSAQEIELFNKQLSNLDLTKLDHELSIKNDNAENQLSGSASGQQLASYSLYMHNLELNIEKPPWRNMSL